MIGSVAAHSADEEGALSHPLLGHRQCRNLQLLVLAGEQGLCGPFNSNVFKTAGKFAEERQGQNVELELLGLKAVNFYSLCREGVSGSWEQVLDMSDCTIAALHHCERKAGTNAPATLSSVHGFDRIVNQSSTKAGACAPATRDG